MIRVTGTQGLRTESAGVRHFTRITRVASTRSTNADMARMLGSAESRGLTIVADFQTDGRGRKGRQWIAPSGSALLFTTALPELVPREHLWAVPFWTALVVHGALAEAGFAAGVQWPNDLLLDAKKVAGILCISRVAGESAWTACGVGLNVLRPSNESSDAVAPGAAFLSDIRAIEPQRLLQSILQHADAMYGDLGSPQTVAAQWEKAARIPGTRYRILRDGTADVLEGVAVGLADEGELIIENAGGRHTVTMADARVVRN